ncbi:phospholipase/carboxylesterase/thioesterase domain-containing protein [Pseudoscourfieldia marina]
MVNPPSSGKAGSCRATVVDVPLTRALDGEHASLPALLYKPKSPPCAVLVVAPGSSGGMGPGIETRHAGLPVECHRERAAFGSIYRRLGAELASGVAHAWDGKAKQGAANLLEGKQAAVLHMTWRHCRGGVKWPGPALKRVESLKMSSEDMASAADYARDMFGHDVPVVLCGFSFGGPTAIAAAASLTAAGQAPAAVVSIAGSGRGGDAFENASLATASALASVACEGVPTLFLHGTEDKNVALDVSRYLHLIASNNADAAPTTLAVVEGSAHMFDVARDIAYTALTGWLRQLLVSHDMPSIVPLGPGAKAVQLRLDRRQTRSSRVAYGTSRGIWPSAAKDAGEGRPAWGSAGGGGTTPAIRAPSARIGRAGPKARPASAERVHLPPLSLSQRVGIAVSSFAPQRGVSAAPTTCKGWGQRTEAAMRRNKKVANGS